MELQFFEVDDGKHQNGILYSLIFIDKVSKKKVLMDNHYPKGPHYHIDGKEFNYKYTNDETLVNDFKKLVYHHFGEKI